MAGKQGSLLKTPSAACFPISAYILPPSHTHLSLGAMLFSSSMSVLNPFAQCAIQFGCPVGALPLPAGKRTSPHLWLISGSISTCPFMGQPFPSLSLAGAALPQFVCMLHCVMV